MRSLLKGVVLFVLLCAGLAGCESSDCILSSESYCSFSFVNAAGKNIKNSKLIAAIAKQQILMLRMYVN